ncbi:hypothetical protein SmJEL517_g02066 [Synchytrium microbalum]|uniref:non-specific serine/threonine protein kinase n=1 Tax=Synchytrium microbalum TaxID=1806994 RepID=A0A507C210_9FUNG|nr:uncharacterized protein SmJEL517_g02066 [Synchytrium microbalum]TPX35550.1 hypothetical protein SmJEL517_g02066 [Synchytrium microbalum]
MLYSNSQDQNTWSPISDKAVSNGKWPYVSRESNRELQLASDTILEVTKDYKEFSEYLPNRIIEAEIRLEVSRQVYDREDDIIYMLNKADTRYGQGLMNTLVLTGGSGAMITDITEIAAADHGSWRKKVRHVNRVGSGDVLTAISYGIVEVYVRGQVVEETVLAQSSIARVQISSVLLQILGYLVPALVKQDDGELFTIEEADAPHLGGISRLREDSSSSNSSARRSNTPNNSHVSFFPSESPYSFSFTSQSDAKSESRRGLLYKSLDFVKNRNVASKVGTIVTNGLDEEEERLSTPPLRSASSPNLSNLGKQIAAGGLGLVPRSLMGGSSRSPYSPAQASPLSAAFSPIPLIPSIPENIPHPIAVPLIAPLSISTVRKNDYSAMLPPSLPSAPVMRARSLHSPTRFLPPNKAMMTTNADMKVLTANDQALFIFATPQRELIGASILNLLVPSYREKYQKYFRQDPQKKDVVLVCGKVIRVLKKDGTQVPTSLWLKRTLDDKGGSIFIWVLEAIKETTVAVIVSAMTCELVEVRGPFEELFGWEPQEVYDLKITDLIPAIDNGNSHVKDFEVINEHKFFGARSRRGAVVPIIAKYFGNAEDNPLSLGRQPGHVHIQITSMPNIAGVLTCDSKGNVQSCNSVFAKYLFGLGSKHLEGKVITEVIPQFWQLVETFEDGRSEKIISAREARRVAAAGGSPLLGAIESERPAEAHFTVGSPVVNVFRGSPPSNGGMSGRNIPPSNSSTGIVAIHRDGSTINVDVQVRAVNSHLDTVYALWITYDRSFGVPKSKQNLHPSAPSSISASPNLAPSDVPSTSSSEKDRDRAIDEAALRLAGLMDESVAETRTSPKQVKMPSPVFASATSTSIDDYEILDSLGDGAYGYVRLAVKKNDPKKTKVVVKYIVKSRILVDCWTRDKELGLVPLEVHILHYLTSIRHPNVVHMIEHFEDPDFCYIVMSLHGFGMDLFDYIELNQTLPEEEIRSIFYQTVLGIRHLHRNGIVHRDIKDENLILDEELRVQLIDFGSSAYIKDGKKFDTFCGTLDYAAPEVLTGHKYTGPPQDCWALGILLYTLTYKENPFYNIDEIISRELRVPFVMSEDSIDLIRFILDRDVKARPTIDEIEQHRWFDNIRAKYNTEA